MSDTTQKPFVPVKPEAITALSASFADYAVYLKQLGEAAFPKLNLALLDRAAGEPYDLMRDELQKIRYSDKVMARLPRGSEMDVDAAFAEHLGQLNFVQQHGDGKFDALKKETIELGVDHPGQFIMSFPGGLVDQVGGKLSPIFMNSHHCKSCSSEPSPANKDINTQIINFLDQMGRTYTGYHELGHAADFDSRSLAGTAFNILSSGKNMVGLTESTANTFATLMTVRDFGTLGEKYAEFRGLQIGADGAHTNNLSELAALQWARNNPDDLRNGSISDLLKVAQKLSRDNAPTTEDVRFIDDYLAYRNSSSIKTPQERLDKLAQDNRQGLTPDPAYKPEFQALDQQIILNFAKLPEIGVELRKIFTEQMSQPSVESVKGIDTTALNKPEADAAPLVSPPARRTTPVTPSTP